MADKAKHAFGALERVDSAIQSGTIDAYDILFVKDKNGKPYVGWVDKDGEKMIVDDSAEMAKLEAEIATKANAEEVEAEIAKKANAEEVKAELETKANAKEVESKIADSVSTAKAYTDGKIEAAISEHMVKKYEITNVPAGTLVDYHESEIRIMCPESAVFAKQNVGVGGDPNTYYATFKTYVFDDNVVGYIEHLGNQVDKEILTTFSTDEYGRRYQTTWLGLATYNEATDTWNYYGKNSTTSKYIGWDYQLDLYDANGVMIASDSIRISLSNEKCHSSAKPYYVGTMMTEVETKIEEKVKELESSYEIIEF